MSPVVRPYLVVNSYAIYNEEDAKSKRTKNKAWAKPTKMKMSVAINDNVIRRWVGCDYETKKQGLTGRLIPLYTYVLRRNPPQLSKRG